MRTSVFIRLIAQGFRLKLRVLAGTNQALPTSIPTSLEILRDNDRQRDIVLDFYPDGAVTFTSFKYTQNNAVKT